MIFFSYYRIQFLSIVNRNFFVFNILQWKILVQNVDGKIAAEMKKLFMLAFSNDKPGKCLSVFQYFKCTKAMFS